MKKILLDIRKQKYLTKLKDPKWQKKRLDVFNRDEWCCQLCHSKENTLHVHHKYYINNSDPWDYPMDALVTLCEFCHQEESENREHEEKRILFALKKHFFSEDLKHLANGFENLELPHVHYCVSHTLMEILINKNNILYYLIDLSFKWAMEEHKSKQQGCCENGSEISGNNIK